MNHNSYDLNEMSYTDVNNNLKHRLLSSLPIKTVYKKNIFLLAISIISL